MENEIVLKQKPVITHDLVRVGKSVTERLKALNIEGQIATLETVQALKKLRAELNKERAEYDSQVKAVKLAVMNPYKELEDSYKIEVSDKYDSADKSLKDKIAFVENEVKLNKKKSVESYFNELCLSEKIDFITFENVGLDINLSTTEKAYKEKCNEFVSKIVDDLDLIDTQEFKAEILVQYRKTLNASKSIKEVQDRKELERQEIERQRLQEIQRRRNNMDFWGMVYIDFVKLYEYPQNSEIFITLDDIENLSKEDFENKKIQLEESIRLDVLAKRALIVEPIIQEQTTTLDTPPPYEAKYVATAPEPLPEPIIEKKEPLVTASFECTGTYAQLKSVGNFMKQNNIPYKNI